MLPDQSCHKFNHRSKHMFIHSLHPFPSNTQAVAAPHSKTLTVRAARPQRSLHRASVRPCVRGVRVCVCVTYCSCMCVYVRVQRASVHALVRAMDVYALVRAIERACMRPSVNAMPCHAVLCRAMPCRAVPCRPCSRSSRAALRRGAPRRAAPSWTEPCRAVHAC